MSKESDTPRVDAVNAEHSKSTDLFSDDYIDMLEHARQLERELAEISALERNQAAIHRSTLESHANLKRELTEARKALELRDLRDEQDMATQKRLRDEVEALRADAERHDNAVKLLQSVMDRANRHEIGVLDPQTTCGGGCYTFWDEITHFLARTAK